MPGGGFLKSDNEVLSLEELVKNVSQIKKIKSEGETLMQTFLMNHDHIFFFCYLYNSQNYEIHESWDKVACFLMFLFFFFLLYFSRNRRQVCLKMRN